jgi:hypothetical protein
MGMDVYGNKPADETGEYFRNNVWWWHPLADYCAEISPDTASRCQGWHSNDGDGLDADDSLALANALQREIDSGRCEVKVKVREAQLATLPNEPTLPNERCDSCAGTGSLTMQQIKRIEEKRAAIESGCSLDELFGLLHKFRVGEKCNWCQGTGSRRAYARNYAFSVENVQNFVAFLRACGGFRIC